MIDLFCTRLTVNLVSWLDTLMDLASLIGLVFIRHPVELLHCNLGLGTKARIEKSFDLSLLPKVKLLLITLCVYL